MNLSYAPIEFIQMLCATKDSSILILSHVDQPLGMIEIRAGEIWSAFDALGTGEMAFARLIQSPHRARAWSDKPSQMERSITGDAQSLVLRSLSLVDEGRAPRPPIVSLSALERQLNSKKPQSVQLKNLTNRARAELMTKDYESAAETLARLAELDPGSQFVRANLNQLRRLGIIS